MLSNHMAGKKGAAKAEEKGDDLEPKVREAAPAAKEDKTADFSFAVNAIKLNRAKAHVNATQPGLKGKALEDAVRERYIEIKGLLRGESVPAGRKPRGPVQNMAEDDGSKD